MKKIKPLVERLQKHIEIIDDCWLWTAAKNNAGYGLVRVNDKMVTAHRASYETYIGSVPLGKNICHTCNNISCINPQHLIPLTHQENTIKRMSEGRNYGKRLFYR